MTTASDSGTEGARWSLRLLGGCDLVAHSPDEKVASLGKRERVLLAYLALSANCRAPRRKLATLLWGDATDETATDNLRVCVFNLRKALGAAGHRVIVSEGKDIVLDAAAFEIDASKFRSLAAQSGRAELEAAAKLYSGEFLDGLGIESEEYESWRREEAGRFREQIVDVLARLMMQLADLRETEPAIEAGLRLLRFDPLHEAAVRRLMRLYGEGGRRGAAVQLYRAFAETLKAELNAQPEAETRAVLAEISRGSEGTHAPAAPATTPVKATPSSPPEPSANAAPREPPPAQNVVAPPVRASQTMTVRHTRSRALGWIAAGGLAAAVLAVFFLYQFAPSASSTNGSPGAGAVSVAVLPFVNLSGDDGQEFFSDGITEEITAALAKVTGLHVVARTSAFQFKGQNRDIQAIGEQLHASHLIEGSVRKAGDRLRVTAQLIDASNGTNLWSENYDRQLTDIFAIQEDIAQAIARALRVPLGLQQGESLVSSATGDLESYQEFLRASNSKSRA